MRTRARLTVVLGCLALGCTGWAGPALAQTRTQQTKPTTTAAPPRTTSTQTTRTVPTTTPIDPGSLTGLPSTGSPTGPDYGPAGGTRTVRPRRSADPSPDTGSGDEIPYVDPPAAPGYESVADAPMRTAGGRPPPPGSTHTAAPAPPAPPTPQVPAATAAPAVPPPPATPPQATNEAAIVEGPAQPATNPNALWIALAGLAAMLAAAALGLRHILTAPHLSYRVTVDHGVQSAPRFKGAAS